MTINREIAVIGGTPFDTQKGLQYLWQHGVRAVPIAISRKPSEQAALYERPEHLLKLLEERLAVRPFDELVFYCNSMSFICNWSALLPHKVHELTSYYQPLIADSKNWKTAYLVAEPRTEKNLRKFARAINPEAADQLDIFSQLPLIEAIEQASFREQYALIDQAITAYRNQGYQRIVLGCTHLDHPDLFQKDRESVIQPGLELLHDVIHHLGNGQDTPQD